MTIKTNDRGDWTVVAEWHGAERVVFVGSIWQCIRFKRQCIRFKSQQS